MKNRVQEIFKESIRVKQKFVDENLDKLWDAINCLANVLRRGNKILLFGNGGSAADAQHIAAEFVNRFMIDRPPLRAVALTTDTSVITAIANDFSYEEIFEKQVKALGRAGDAAIGISTSGKSLNVNRGLRVARQLGLITVGIGGPADSPMRKECDHYLSVEGGPTPRIQEVHLVIGHTLCEGVDRILFGGENESQGREP